MNSLCEFNKCSETVCNVEKKQIRDILIYDRYLSVVYNYNHS